LKAELSYAIFRNYLAIKIQKQQRYTPVQATRALGKIISPLDTMDFKEIKV